MDCVAEGTLIGRITNNVFHCGNLSFPVIYESKEFNDGEDYIFDGLLYFTNLHRPIFVIRSCYPNTLSLDSKAEFYLTLNLIGEPGKQDVQIRNTIVPIVVECNIVESHSAYYTADLRCIDGAWTFILKGVDVEE